MNFETAHYTFKKTNVEAAEYICKFFFNKASREDTMVRFPVMWSALVDLINKNNELGTTISRILKSKWAEYQKSAGYAEFYKTNKPKFHTQDPTGKHYLFAQIKAQQLLPIMMLGSNNINEFNDLRIQQEFGKIYSNELGIPYSESLANRMVPLVAVSAIVSIALFLLAGTYVLYEFVLSSAETKFLEAQTEHLRTQASILLMQEEAVRQASEQTSKAVADCVANMGQDHFIECLEYANKSTVDIQNAVGKAFEGVLKSNPIKSPTPSGISGVLSELKVPLLIGGGIFGLFVFWKIKQSKKEA